MSLSQQKVKCIAEGCQYEQVPTEVRRHIRNVHKDEPLVEKFNLMLVATKAEIRGTGVFSCEKCSKHFTTASSLSNHLRKVHVNRAINPVDISLSPVASPPSEPARKKDPELPDDIHEEEEEARVTEWKRCALCKIPVHFTCAMTAKRCACNPVSHFENYPDDYQMESDESADC